MKIDTDVLKIFLRKINGKGNWISANEMHAAKNQQISLPN